MITHVIIILLLIYIIFKLEKKQSSGCPCDTYNNNEMQYTDPLSASVDRRSPFVRGSFQQGQGIPYFEPSQLKQTVAYQIPEEYLQNYQSQGDNIQYMRSPSMLPRSMNNVYSTYGYPYLPSNVPSYSAMPPEY